MTELVDGNMSLKAVELNRAINVLLTYIYDQRLFPSLFEARPCSYEGGNGKDETQP